MIELLKGFPDNVIAFALHGSSVHSKGLTESWVIAKPAGTPMIRILGTYDDGT